MIRPSILILCLVLLGWLIPRSPAADSVPLAPDDEIPLELLPCDCGAQNDPDPVLEGAYLRNRGSQCGVVAIYNAVVDAGYTISLDDYMAFRACLIEAGSYRVNRGTFSHGDLPSKTAECLKLLTGKDMEAESYFNPSPEQWDSVFED